SCRRGGDLRTRHHQRTAAPRIRTQPGHPVPDAASARGARLSRVAATAQRAQRAPHLSGHACRAGGPGRSEGQGARAVGGAVRGENDMTTDRIRRAAMLVTLLAAPASVTAVQSQPTTTQPSKNETRLPGTLVADQSVELYAKISGYV